MSSEPRITDAMVDALLATHQVPALREDFADQVLAAAQSSRASPNNLPWPRRSLRPWRRSPLWLGVIALNIIAASAVAAMVSGIPVWHHVTELVQKVTHGWHRAPVHSGPHRVLQRPLVASRPPALSSPTMATAAAEPRPAAVLSLATQKAITPVQQFHPLAERIANRGYHHTRMMPKHRREGPIRYRPKYLFRAHGQFQGSEFPNPKRRSSPEVIPQVRRDHASSPAKASGGALPRDPRSVATEPPVPYGPSLEPQGTLRERRQRDRWPLDTSMKVRAERRRERALDHPPSRQGAPPFVRQHRLHLLGDRMPPRRPRFHF